MIGKIIENYSEPIPQKTIQTHIHKPNLNKDKKESSSRTQKEYVSKAKEHQENNSRKENFKSINKSKNLQSQMNKSRNVGINIKTAFTSTKPNISKTIIKDDSKMPNTPSNATRKISKEAKVTNVIKKEIHPKKVEVNNTKNIFGTFIKKDNGTKSTKALRSNLKNYQDSTSRRQSIEPTHSMTNFSYWLNFISPSSQEGEKVVIVESIIPDGDDIQELISTSEELSQTKPIFSNLLSSSMNSVMSYLPKEQRHNLPMVNKELLRTYLSKSLEVINTKLSSLEKIIAKLTTETKGRLLKQNPREFKLSEDLKNNIENFSKNEINEFILNADLKTQNLLRCFAIFSEGKELDWESTKKLILGNISSKEFGVYIQEVIKKFNPTSKEIYLMKKYIDNNSESIKIFEYKKGTMQMTLLSIIIEVISFWGVINPNPEQTLIQSKYLFELLTEFKIKIAHLEHP